MNQRRPTIVTTDYLPLVFYQPTERNERIASLLSSVTLRRTVHTSDCWNDAVRASLERNERLNNVVIHNNGRRRRINNTPVVLFVIVPSTTASSSVATRQLCKSLQQVVQRQQRGLFLSVELLVAETKTYENHNNCATAASSTLHNLFKLLAHAETPVIVIDSSESAAWVHQQVLNTSQHADGLNLQGRVTLQHEQDTAFTSSTTTAVATASSVSVPHLIIGTGCSYSSMAAADLNYCRTNPHAIRIHLPLPPATKRNRKQQDTTTTAVTLWTCRTILKFLHAIQVTAAANHPRPLIDEQAPLVTIATDDAHISSRSTTTKDESTVKVLHLQIRASL